MEWNTTSNESIGQPSLVRLKNQWIILSARRWLHHFPGFLLFFKTLKRIFAWKWCSLSLACVAVGPRIRLVHLQTLRDSTTIFRTNSRTLYTEGLGRLRHRQAVPGYEIVGSAEGPRGLRKRERRESAFSPLSESRVQARDDGASGNEKKTMLNPTKTKNMRVNLGLN